MDGFVQVRGVHAALCFNLAINLVICLNPSGLAFCFSRYTSRLCRSYAVISAGRAKPGTDRELTGFFPGLDRVGF